MATWDDLVGFIRGNYKVAVDDDGHLGLIFETADLRSQSVHLWRATLLDGAEQWAQIESPIGKPGEGDVQAVLKEVGGMVCGGLALTGDYYVFRHSIPLENVDANEIRRPLSLVVGTADRLEKLYTGRDDF